MEGIGRIEPPPSPTHLFNSLGGIAPFTAYSSSNTRLKFCAPTNASNTPLVFNCGQQRNATAPGAITDQADQDDIQVVMAYRQQLSACWDADKKLAAWVLKMDRAERKGMVVQAKGNTTEEAKMEERKEVKVETE